MSVTEESHFTLSWHDSLDLNAGESFGSLSLLEVQIIISIFQLIIESIGCWGA